MSTKRVQAQVHQSTSTVAHDEPPVKNRPAAGALALTLDTTLEVDLYRQHGTTVVRQTVCGAP